MTENERMVAEEFWPGRARGARNIAAGESPQGVAVAWHEKGAQWDQEMDG